MKTSSSPKRFFILIALVLCLSPISARAATIFIAPPKEPLSVGRTSLIMVMINTEDAEINAAEGTLRFSTPNDVVTITNGGSVFNLWPRKASLEADTISFVGGTTAGVYGSSLKLFTIAVRPTSEASIEISLKNATAYLNDGKGTATNITGRSITLPVRAASEAVDDELVTLLSIDTTPPGSFEIELGSDPMLYDGKYFLSFYASDNDSGLIRYEVTEGERALVRSGNTYVLQDQTLSSTVIVHAIDAAGNEQIETFKPGNETSSHMRVLIIIAFVLGALCYFIYKRKR